MTEGIGQKLNNSINSQIKEKSSEYDSKVEQTNYWGDLFNKISSEKKAVEAQYQSAKATIENPPTVEVTESSKKGTNTTNEVHEASVVKAEQEIKGLEAELAELNKQFEAGKQVFVSVNSEESDVRNELENLQTQNQTLNETEEIFDKFLNAYAENESFASPEDEQEQYDQLQNLLTEISSWDEVGDNNKQDINEYVNTINEFFNGEDGYFQQKSS